MRSSVGLSGADRLGTRLGCLYNSIAHRALPWESDARPVCAGRAPQISIWYRYITVKVRGILFKTFGPFCSRRFELLLRRNPILEPKQLVLTEIE